MLSKHGKTASVIELLTPKLAEFVTVKSYSARKSQIVRLIEMMWAVVKHRANVSLVLIDAFSSRAFWYCYAVALLCRVLRIPYAPILHGGDFPTLNRYAYLKKAIYSLLNNPVPPSEIVVVDQSPENTRPADYYDEFDPRVVKVHFLKQAGQSTARNYAIRQSNQDWIYFFDDDSEAWEDTIVEHIRLLEYSVADVSTGVSLAPWKDRSYIGDEISFYHVASVLDTGNCMMRRSLVEQVGLFDPAFDKGSGADDNLGKRLFLSGACIVFNPSAIRTHHKAPMGGLRQHGAWWKNKGTYFGPFPLPTDSYDFARFYPRRYYLRLCLFRLISSYRGSGFAMNVVNTLLFPLKVWISYRKSLKLLRIGIR